jgi:hypothetical protein
MTEDSTQRGYVNGHSLDQQGANDVLSVFTMQGFYLLKRLDRYFSRHCLRLSFRLAEKGESFVLF